MRNIDMIHRSSRSRTPASQADHSSTVSDGRRSFLKASGALAIGSIATAAAGAGRDGVVDPTLQSTFIADAVSHGYNYSIANSFDPKFGPLVGETLYKQAHVGLQPDGPQWKLSKERFILANDPALVGNALFKESPTDFTVYHEVPFFGFFRDGSSSIEVGKAMREMYGADRVAMYGGISPLQPDAMARMDDLAITPGVVGLKLYPGDVINAQFKPELMSDSASTFPIIERARKMGLKSIAVHKAFSLSSTGDLTPFNVTDVTVAAQAFPDMHFEIVHGGMAFLPETLAVLRACRNVSISLEGPSAFVIKQPGAFAQIMAAFLTVDPKAERLIWSTGCMLVHPRPFLEAFWAFQFPQAMLDAGTPPLTLEMKQRILGGNLARVLGIPAAQQARLIAAKATTYATPWSGGATA
jgi:predicted TIM-barrel fold metal-dependent hydrolase